MIRQYLSADGVTTNDSRVGAIKASAFLSSILIIFVILIEFLYKFNPNNLPQFIVICLFTGFLSSWLVVESYNLSKYFKSNSLLWLSIIQFVYGFSREIFLVLNYQSDFAHQNQHALMRPDFKAFPFILIYCILFMAQLSQILKLFVEYLRDINNDFQKILNVQPVALICFSRFNYETIFINQHFRDRFGFKEEDIPFLQDWLNYFKYPTALQDFNQNFTNLQNELYTIQGDTKIVRLSRELFQDIIIDTLVDITEEEHKNALIRQNQKELLSRSISDKEYALEQVNRVSEEFSTENKLLVSSLLKANKTLSSGALAASIAHELTQPLTAMNLNLELLIYQLNNKKLNSENSKAIATKIIKDNDRIGKIIHSLRAIFTDSQGSINLNSLNEVVDTVINLIAPECHKRNIKLEIIMPEGVQAFFRPEEIRQVLLNVLGNSINALENIEDRPRIIKMTAAKLRDSVELTIFDTGPGVPPHLESNLFELLNTSKKDGMGLGLWLSKYILTKTGGDIKYRHVEGWGAVFQINLPLSFKPSALRGGLSPLNKML